MNRMEFGTQNTPVLMLLHGGGLSWWNYRQAAERLSRKYHVVLPILDGHAGSDAHFTGIEDNARHLLDWIDLHFGGHICLLGGLSLGAQIAVELLSQRPNLCDYALLESPALIPDRLTSALISPAFSASYGLIAQEWFARLQFRSLRMPEELFSDYFRDTGRISKGDLIAFTRASTDYQLPEGLSFTSAKVRIVVGQREGRRMHRSAGLLHRAVPGSALTVAEGLYHGEYSMKYPERFSEELEAWMLQGDTGENAAHCAGIQ